MSQRLLTCIIIVSPEALFSLRGKQQDCHRFFKKVDETVCGNYRPVSLLSVPSKILEAEINDTEIYFIKRVDKGRMATVKDLES